MSLRINPLWCVVALVLGACSSPSGNTGMVRTQEQYIQTVNTVLATSSSAVQTFESGIPLTATDREDLNAALKQLDSAIQFNPASFQGPLIRGRILRSLGQDAEAQRSFKQGVINAPRDLNSQGDKEMVAEANNALANYATLDGNLDEAARYVDEARRILPDNPVYAVNRAQIAVNQKEVDKAKAILAEVLKANPDFPSAVQLKNFIEYAQKDRAAKP